MILSQQENLEAAFCWVSWSFNPLAAALREEPVWTHGIQVPIIHGGRIPGEKAQQRFPPAHEEMRLVEIHDELVEMWINLTTYPRWAL